MPLRAEKNGYPKELSKEVTSTSQCRDPYANRLKDHEDPLRIVEWRDPSASWLKLPLVLAKLVDYTDLRAYNQGFMLANSLCIKRGDHERGRHLPSRF